MRHLGESDASGALRVLQSASCTYRIALGPRAGQPVVRCRRCPVVRRTPNRGASSGTCSACMPPSAVGCSNAKSWSGCAARSRARPLPMIGWRVTLRGR